MSGSDPSVSISRRGGTGAGGVGANDGAEYRCPGAPFQTVLASPDPEHVASSVSYTHLTLPTIYSV